MDEWLKCREIEVNCWRSIAAGWEKTARQMLYAVGVLLFLLAMSLAVNVILLTR